MIDKLYHKMWTHPFSSIMYILMTGVIVIYIYCLYWIIVWLTIMSICKIWIGEKLFINIKQNIFKRKFHRSNYYTYWFLSYNYISLILSRSLSMAPCFQRTLQQNYNLQSVEWALRNHNVTEHNYTVQFMYLFCNINNQQKQHILLKYPSPKIIQPTFDLLK